MTTEAVGIDKARLVTITELRSELTLSPTQEKLASRLLKAVIRTWERKTRRFWQRRENYIQRFETDPGDRSLWTELLPIETVHSIQQHDPGLAASPETIDVADIDINSKMGRLRRSSVDSNTFVVQFTGGPRIWWARHVIVELTGGYVSAEDPAADTQSGGTITAQFHTPDEVTEVILTQIKFMMQRDTTTKIDQRSMSFEAGSINLMDADLHPRFKALAKQLKRRIL